MANYEKIYELAREIERNLGGFGETGEPPKNGTEVNAENLIRHALAIIQEVSKNMPEHPEFVDYSYIDEKIRTLQIDLEWFNRFRKDERDQYLNRC